MLRLQENVQQLVERRHVVGFLGIVRVLRFVRRVVLVVRFVFFRFLVVRMEFFQLVVPERFVGVAVVDDDVGVVVRSGVFLVLELFQ